ncbi:MAG: hypothetical protein ACO3RB_06510 [Ilumatobacteraceae bacterium]
MAEKHSRRKLAKRFASASLALLAIPLGVAAYTGNVASGLLTLATNVWTNDFTSVRVALYP